MITFALASGRPSILVDVLYGTCTTNDTEHGLIQPICELKKRLWLPHQKQVLKECLGSKSFKVGRAHNWRLKRIPYPTTSETIEGLILPTARRYKLVHDFVMICVSYAQGSCWRIFNASMRQRHGKPWGRRFFPSFQRFTIKFWGNQQGLIALRACENASRPAAVYSVLRITVAEVISALRLSFRMANDLLCSTPMENSSARA